MPRPAHPRRSALAAGARVIGLADEDWCWAQLAGATRGVLSSRFAGRTVPLEVDYTLDDEEIQIPIASDHPLLPLFVGREVVLGLAGRSNDGVRWVVRASGVTVLTLFAGTDAISEARRNHPAYHAARSPGDDALLLLPADRLRGYYEQALDAGTGEG